MFGGADGLPDHVVGIVMDDTETFELASSVDDASAQLQFATELADVSMWRHDLVGQRVHLNSRAGTVMGMDARPEGVPLDEVRRRMHPDDLRRGAGHLPARARVVPSEDAQARYKG